MVEETRFDFFETEFKTVIVARAIHPILIISGQRSWQMVEIYFHNGRIL